MRTRLLILTATIALIASTAVIGADAATAQSTAPESTSRALSEVTVIAQRIKLESKSVAAI